MFRLLRFQLETKQDEQMLEDAVLTVWGFLRKKIEDAYTGTIQQAMKWIVMNIVVQDYLTSSSLFQDPLWVKNFIEELESEVRNILGDPGVLFLEGVQLYLGFMGVWVFQQKWTEHFLSPVILLIAGSLLLVFWPVYRYLSLQPGVHRYKRWRVYLGCLFLGLLNVSAVIAPDHPMISWMHTQFVFQSATVTTILTLGLGIVLLGFVGYYRRMNDLVRLRENYRSQLIAFAPWKADVRIRIFKALQRSGGRPVKTRLRHLYKEALLKNSKGGRMDENAIIRDLHRAYGLRMNWQYWVASGIQAFLLLLLIGKGFWLLFDDMSILADYYATPLTTGAILGAMIIGFGLIQGMNYSARLWLYGEDRRISAVIVRVAGLGTMIPVVAVLFGLIPGGMVLGFPINPVSNLWCFWLYLILAGVLQYSKFEWIGPIAEQEERALKD